MTGSPLPVMCQATSPVIGTCDGLAPAAWVYLIVVPLANGPNSFPLPLSSTKILTLGSTLSLPTSRKKPLEVLPGGSGCPDGLTESLQATIGGVVSTQCLTAVSHLTSPCGSSKQARIVSVPSPARPFLALYVKSTSPALSVPSVN